MAYEHTPVLLMEVIVNLQPKPNQNFIDCTIGGGGHAEAILAKIKPQGRLLGLDLDSQAIIASSQRLKAYQPRVRFKEVGFDQLEKIATQEQFNPVDGILFDLGLSSYELASDTRGFSFQTVAPLDMRFGQTGKTAREILNYYPESELIRIFQASGAGRCSGKLARAIVSQRRRKKFYLTSDLVAVIIQNCGFKQRSRKIHPATKIFQALRLEVNQELERLSLALPQALQLLKPGGRLAVISFHSLEDRIVKHFFRQESRDCLCPKAAPICLCRHQPALLIITKKPITPTMIELNSNPRARSAKLRVAQKL